MSALESYLSGVSAAVEDWFCLNMRPPGENSPAAKLYESMIYSLTAGGKRLRPALFFMGYNLVGEAPVNHSHPVLPFAAAAEMIHTYSLIHDDLPDMDDDTLRRGKPTNHMVYGVATAILAGDGLLTKAFEIFADTFYSPEIPAERRLAALKQLSGAVGPDGMVGGQYVDILSEGGVVKNAPEETVTFIHAHKTADFICACAVCGALLAGADDATVSALWEYGMKIGLAFQVTDDILDITASTETLGKNVGSDQERDKLTYPAVYGLEKSHGFAAELLAGAKAAAEPLGDSAAPLLLIADFIGKREK